MTRMSNICLAALALVVSVCISGCRSANIPTEGKSTTLNTSKRAVLSAIAEKAAQPASFRTYYAKNASTNIELGTSSYSVKSNVFIEVGKETVVAARVPFPPLVVGNVKVSEGEISVKSGLLNVNQKIGIPTGAAGIIQSAILGEVPDVFLAVGEKDFNNFDIVVTADNLYRLSRTRGQVSVQLFLNGDLSLSRAHLTMGKQSVTVSVKETSAFSGHTLPSKISLECVPGGKAQNISMDVAISKVTIDGSDRLSFE